MFAHYTGTVHLADPIVACVVLSRCYTNWRKSRHRPGFRLAICCRHYIKL